MIRKGDISYTITPLSRIHIGSGEVLDPFTFIVKDGYAFYLHQLNFIDYLTKNYSAEFKAILNNANYIKIVEFLQSRFNSNIPEIYTLKYPVETRTTPKDVHQFIRTKFLQPIIPGSSLKGAFRTAVISALYSLKQDIKEGPDFEFRVLSPNSKGKPIKVEEDPFKYLKFSDVTINNECISLMEIERTNNLSPKQYPKTWAEVIKKSSAPVGKISITFVMDFLNHEVIKSLFSDNQKALDKLKTLFGHVNDFYKNKLKEDISKMSVIQKKNHLNSILKEFASLEQGDFIMKIGHGSGKSYLQVYHPSYNPPHTSSVIEYQPLGWCKFSFTK